MKSLILFPYSPFPCNHGGKVEMLKHLDILCSLGTCTVLSAAQRPVGMGWTEASRQALAHRGCALRLREDCSPHLPWRQRLAFLYGLLFKGLGLERAFGHGNPYHRHAFPKDFLLQPSQEADLALINYSYWAWLPTACPKVLVLLDLWSNQMWGGSAQETEDLRQADLIVVISKDEEAELRRRGLTKILWSPPLVHPSNFPLSAKVGLTGSANAFNQEGLRWLAQADIPSLPLTVYGALARFAPWPHVRTVTQYADSQQPYQECGIILLPTASGMGVQIKVVEALAAGRALVARKGAMRGLPAGQGAWVEVETAEAMWREAERLHQDAQARKAQAAQARAYYQQHLDAENIQAALRQAYTALAEQRSKENAQRTAPLPTSP
jgi:hypothetical protein